MNHFKSETFIQAARGFTFVEVLAALLFMAIVIPVVTQGLMVANRAGLVSERKRVAAQLADTLLSEMIATDQWRTSAQTGNFDGAHPGYRWVLKNAAWTQTPLREVTIQVWFTVQEKEYEVHLTTLVADETA
jgi:type II secretory pathway pseudopilin PulG